MNLNEPAAPVITLDDRIDDLCDAFEQAWQNGEQPTISAFVERADKEVRSALFHELLLVELEYRFNRGEKPSRTEYLEAFPEFLEQIQAIDFKRGWSTLPATVGIHGAAKPLPLEPGTPIAHFQLVEKLGAGGMGEVWKAWDTRLQRPVAIKLPRAGQLTEMDLHRFLREGRAAAQLRHPQLAAVHDAGREGDLAYIVADYVEGDDLRVYLARQRLSFSAAATLCAEMAEALHHAHEHGVVHRDLKPANIIVDKDGRPHVIDFGLAKWSSDDRDLTVKGELLGTPAYMSPEQARGDIESVGPRTDVYALGVILYELVTGRCPVGGSQAAILHAIIGTEPVPPRRVDRSIPRDLETIGLKALEKEQHKRYQSAQEMAVDLRRFLRGEPIVARPVSRLEKGWRWLRRRPAVAASLALALAVAVASVTIAALMNKNYELQGYRPVRVTTEPEGARVAFVPIDERTGEPNPDPAGIIRPDGTTPLTIDLKPGRYLIEAVVLGREDTPDFAEVFFAVPRLLTPPRGATRIDWRYDREQTFPLGPIVIGRTEDIVADMVRVRIDAAARRKNPLLPKVLYVDAKETAPSDRRPSSNEPHVSVVINDDGDPYIPFSAADSWAEISGKRLPSAAEYDAIIESAKHQQLTVSDSGEPAAVEDLFGGVAEWTTSKYLYRGANRENFGDKLVLKGYDNPDDFPGLFQSWDGQLLASPSHDPSPTIGFRCVRSGAPRFVTE